LARKEWTCPICKGIIREDTPNVWARKEGYERRYRYHENCLERYIEMRIRRHTPKMSRHLNVPREYVEEEKKMFYARVS
jgi:hypothetical protein